MMLLWHLFTIYMAILDLGSSFSIHGTFNKVFFVFNKRKKVKHGGL